MERLVFLHYGLAAILSFIGVKLILHALSTNEIPFINGGQALQGIVEPSIPFSLAFILCTLIITAGASLLATRFCPRSKSRAHTKETSESSDS